MNGICPHCAMMVIGGCAAAIKLVPMAWKTWKFRSINKDA